LIPRATRKIPAATSATLAPALTAHIREMVSPSNPAATPRAGERNSMVVAFDVRRRAAAGGAAIKEMAKIAPTAGRAAITVRVVSRSRRASIAVSLKPAAR
jgi:hypothetical protein